jgi:hypothetical protein
MDNDVYPEIPGHIKEMIASGEITDEIFLDKEGVWYHNREKFSNQRIIDFFNRSVNITSSGEYVIHYGNYTYPITVEDAPVFVTGVIFSGFGEFETIQINLSNGETEELDCSTLYVKNNNSLYCKVRSGRLTAKFKRSPSFHILERLEEDSAGVYYLYLCGEKFKLKRETE